MKTLAEILLILFLIIIGIGILCLLANLVLPFYYPELLMYTAPMSGFAAIITIIAACPWEPLENIMRHLDK